MNNMTIKNIHKNLYFTTRINNNFILVTLTRYYLQPRRNFNSGLELNR